MKNIFVLIIITLLTATAVAQQSKERVCCEEVSNWNKETKTFLPSTKKCTHYIFDTLPDIEISFRYDTIARIYDTVYKCLIVYDEINYYRIAENYFSKNDSTKEWERSSYRSYRYDSRNNEISCTKFSPDDDSKNWRRARVDSFLFDSDNNQTFIGYYEYDDSTSKSVIYSDEEIYTFNSNKDFTSITHNSFHPSQGDRYSYSHNYENTYSNNNKKRISIIKGESPSENDMKVINKYNSDKRITRSTVCKWNITANDWDYINLLIKKKYDSHNNKTYELLKMRGRGDKKLSKNSETFYSNYNEYGEPGLTIDTTFDNSGGIAWSTKTITTCTDLPVK